MPLDTSRSDTPRKFVLMFLSGLIKKMNFIRGGDCDGWIYRHIGHCDSNNLLVGLFEIFKLDLRE
jgi:hypothetical protein